MPSFVGVFTQQSTWHQLTRLFDQQVGAWPVEVIVTELAAEIGTLADSIMIQQGHRPARTGETIDLEDDLADVLFLLIRLADHSHIDLAHAYQTMLQTTRGKLMAHMHEPHTQTHAESRKEQQRTGEGAQVESPH